jgi:anti-anti-sigma factor
MEISSEQVQGRVSVTVLRLKGDLDASSADAFSAAANQAVDNGAKDILLDFSGVPFMSSAGLRALHALFSLLHPSNSQQEKDAIYQGISAGTYSAPHLKLLRPSQKVEDVLKMSGMDMYLKWYKDEKEAIATF